MQEPRTRVHAGQEVEVRDEPWVVVSTEHFDGVVLLTLRGVGGDNRGAIQRLLTPFDTVRTVVPRARLTHARRRTVLAHAATAIASSPRWRGSWTAGGAHIDLRPWQIEPALAATAGAQRILLADEVGLGKTIQAALIVSELTARGLAQRVLVLTPPSLRAQWAAELWDKFRMAATVLDHASLSATIAALPVGVNPWMAAPVIVSSIDLVKRPEVRTALDQVPLDILIVDEAHHITPGTDRGAVVADLAARTMWVVLSTATPHSGDEDAYQFLQTIGSLGDAQPLVTYRRATADVHAAAARRTHLLGVMPTPAERELLDATLAYCRLLWRAPTGRAGVALVASVIARRAASSAAAARSTLERRLALLDGSVLPAAQAVLPWDEDADDDESDDRLAVPGLPSQVEEITWLKRLIDLARVAEPLSSKVRIIRRLLRRTDEHVIVFSEYRDVVREVAVQIADLSSAAVIHGGVATSIRRDLIRAFTEGRVRVLITTDAAGEGLNLQAACRLVVNLELPWNPLRLEQRVGRVDRIGQRRTVHAIHLYHRESFEDVVLSHLERRRARASVLRETTASIGIDDLETERRLRTLVLPHGHPPIGAGPLIARHGPRRRTACHVVLLFAADIVDAAGLMVQRLLLPLCVDGPPLRSARQLSKGRVQQLAGDRGVHAVLRREIQAGLASVHGDVGRTATALEQRLRGLMTALEQRRSRLLFQGSLFDRRSEQQAQSRDATVQALGDYFARRLVATHALTVLRVSEPRLIAAWLIA